MVDFRMGSFVNYRLIEYDAGVSPSGNRRLFIHIVIPMGGNDGASQRKIVKGLCKMFDPPRNKCMDFYNIGTKLNLPI